MTARYDRGARVLAHCVSCDRELTRSATIEKETHCKRCRKRERKLERRAEEG